MTPPTNPCATYVVFFVYPTPCSLRLFTTSLRCDVTERGREREREEEKRERFLKKFVKSKVAFWRRNTFIRSKFQKGNGKVNSRARAWKIKTYYFAGPRITFEAYAAPTIVLIFNTVFNVMFMLCFFVRVEREESANDEFVVSQFANYFFYFFSTSFGLSWAFESGFFSEQKERQRTTNELLFIENDNSFV